MTSDTRHEGVCIVVGTEENINSKMPQDLLNKSMLSYKDNTEENNELLVKDFVSRQKGHKSITKVLVANNGMAAVKAIRSIRKW